MGLLERLGLVRGKARPVGQQLERGRPEDEESVQRNLLLKGGIFLALIVITLLAFPRGEVYEYTVQVGDTWRQQTLVAPFSFPIYKDEATLEAERQAVRERTPPYFREVPDAQERVQAHREAVAEQLQRTFEAYVASQRHLLQGEALEAAQDSLRYLELRRDARPVMSPDQWRILAREYLAHQPGLLPDSLAGTGPPLYEQLLEDAWALSMQLLSVGVMNIPRDEVLTDEVIIRNEEERTDRAKPKDNLYGLDEAYRYAQDYFRDSYPERPERASIANALFRAIFQPSLAYMQAGTVQAWERAQQGISPTRGVVQRGEVVVQQDERITEEVKRKLTSLERAQNERVGRAILWKQVGGGFILVLTTYLVFFLYLFFLRREIFDDNRAVFLITLLFAGVIALFAIVVRMPGVGLYVVPVAIASVHLTIMFDSRVGLFGTLTLALIGGQLSGFNLEYTLATLFAGLLGVFSVRDIKNRSQYFISGGLVLVGYLLVLTGSWLFFGSPTDHFASEVRLVTVNALFVVMAYPILWVFERAFDVTTDLTLLELSDTNRPLLKELSLRAPGTFNHSLQVANLAEAAADRVGANALLARVGALYHDIGKMLKPEYYVENQRTGDNPHDRLKPRMSALIIASHVKEGLEMGREYNLPQRVLNFIPMHHGTTRIEYFYRKALEERRPEEPEVMESEFRYPGPRPHARETGILMLADSVEAASRSLEDPTHKRLETLIDALFQARIEDHQLDDTDLTFRDLRLIKETFLSMLMGIYHVRVKYPGREEDGSEEAGASRRAEKKEKQEKEPARRSASEDTEGEVWGIPEQSIRARRPDADRSASPDAEKEPAPGDGLPQGPDAERKQPES